MGVRLYINTNDVCVLEKCAGVPAGTKEAYKKFEADTADMDGYEQYCMLKDSEHDLYNWNQFQLFGFGRFASPVDEPCGEETGAKAVKLWLSAQKAFSFGPYNYILEAISKYGVCWS